MLPQNRRLRHLQGIYLRNLSFAKPHGRAIDDIDVDLTSNKSPPEGQQPQQQQLYHARSSESLRPRPNARRRSTTLANVTPVSRQKQLEFTVESRAADVFFSLHCWEGEVDADEDEPVYISEVGERSMNFNFRFFDLSQTASSAVTRSSQFKIKLWARRQRAWSLLLTQTIDLQSLNYLGSLRNQPFPPNCLIFHLSDGMYSLDVSGKRSEPKQNPTLMTSSYNALMKLSNLDNSIQDALATRDSLAARINSILQRRSPNAVPQAQESALRASKYVSTQKRALQTAQARRADLQASINARRKAIKEGLEAQERASEDVEHARSKLASSHELISTTHEGIHGQRRRICEDLSRIFPIVPNPSGPPLSFTICGVSLPNTDYDLSSSPSAEDSLSAGLGYVAQLASALQFYLSVALPYPTSSFGSRSSIRDDISLLPDLQREFPLFLRGGATAQHKFDYGWFLLNKNIEALCVAAGLRVVDIRHTLPNLKYLLYVCSAGSDEVPERKRGGVRGLWAGRMKGRGGATGMDDGGGGASAGGSRRGSTDSEALGGGGGRQIDKLNRALVRENGHGPGQGHGHVGLPFDEGIGKLTLRTKGLRENIGTRA